MNPRCLLGTSNKTTHQALGRTKSCTKIPMPPSTSSKYGGRNSSNVNCDEGKIRKVSWNWHKSLLHQHHLEACYKIDSQDFQN